MEKTSFTFDIFMTIFYLKVIFVFIDEIFKSVYFFKEVGVHLEHIIKFL